MQRVNSFIAVYCTHTDFNMSEHYELPQASVNRMIKAALPKSVQVSKEVKHKMAKAAGLFVLYLTDA